MPLETIAASSIPILVTLILSSIPAAMVSARRILRSHVEIDAILRAPAEEEFAFRYLPAAIHVAALIVIAVGAVVSISGQTVRPPVESWLPLSATMTILAGLFALSPSANRDDLFFVPCSDRSHLAITMQPLRPRIDDFGDLLSHGALQLVLQLLCTKPGLAFLAVVAAAEGGLMWAAAARVSFTEATALATFASASAASVHVLLIWLRSASLFADAHVQDSLSVLAVPEDTYRRRLRAVALAWGAPYALSLLAGFGVVASALTTTGSTPLRVLLGLLIVVVALPASYRLTSRFHLAANRSAWRTRERLDPLFGLEALVTRMQPRGVSARTLVGWLHALRSELGPSCPLPDNDRLIAGVLLASLDDSATDDGRRHYEQICELAERLVDSYGLMERPGRERLAYLRRPTVMSPADARNLRSELRITFGPVSQPVDQSGRRSQ